MELISLADFRRAPAKAIEHLPVAVTMDGTVTFYVVKGDTDVIIISDLHPRVRNMLRAMEKRARAGMSTKALKLEDLKEEPSKES